MCWFNDNVPLLFSSRNVSRSLNTHSLPHFHSYHVQWNRNWTVQAEIEIGMKTSITERETSKSRCSVVMYCDDLHNEHGMYLVAHHSHTLWIPLGTLAHTQVSLFQR